MEHLIEKTRRKFDLESAKELHKTLLEQGYDVGSYRVSIRLGERMLGGISYDDSKINDNSYDGECILMNISMYACLNKVWVALKQGNNGTLIIDIRIAKEFKEENKASDLVRNIEEFFCS